MYFGPILDVSMREDQKIVESLSFFKVEPKQVEDLSHHLAIFGFASPVSSMVLKYQLWLNGIR